MEKHSKTQKNEEKYWKQKQEQLKVLVPKVTEAEEQKKEAEEAAGDASCWQRRSAVYGHKKIGLESLYKEKKTDRRKGRPD